MDQTLHYVVIQLDLQQVNGILIFGIFFNSTIPANGTKLIKMTWDLNGLNVAILFSIDIVSRTLFGNINLIKTFSEWSIPNRKFTSIHRNAIYNVNEQHMKITPYSFPPAPSTKRSEIDESFATLMLHQVNVIEHQFAVNCYWFFLRGSENNSLQQISHSNKIIKVRVELNNCFCIGCCFFERRKVRNQHTENRRDE